MAEAQVSASLQTPSAKYLALFIICHLGQPCRLPHPSAERIMNLKIQDGNGVVSVQVIGTFFAAKFWEQKYVIRVYYLNTLASLFVRSLLDVKCLKKLPRIKFMCSILLTLVWAGITWSLSVYLQTQNAQEVFLSHLYSFQLKDGKGSPTHSLKV